MAYYSPSKVQIIAAPGATHEYIWGDKQLALVRCATCGCFSHWRGLLPPKPDEKMGVNARLFNKDIAQIPIRRFDGAETWKFLD